uniref:1,4-alpha-glucan branching enzyme n=1 Tax=Ascaris lumbricoides TaxID=6252 RepID=A0A0M3HSM6_ASCLU
MLSAEIGGGDSRLQAWATVSRMFVTDKVRIIQVQAIHFYWQLAFGLYRLWYSSGRVTEDRTGSRFDCDQDRGYV